MGSGSQLTALQQQGKDRLDVILADGQVAAGEQAAFQQAFSSLISGWQADTASVLAAMQNANSITAQLASGLANVRSVQDRLQQQVNQLSGR